jgi:hypothetical protein
MTAPTYHVTLSDKVTHFSRTQTGTETHCCITPRQVFIALDAVDALRSLLDDFSDSELDTPPIQAASKILAEFEEA